MRPYVESMWQQVRHVGVVREEPGICRDMCEIMKGKGQVCTGTHVWAMGVRRSMHGDICKL